MSAPAWRFGLIVLCNGMQWEDRCRAECARLKEDLGKLHAEEKHLAVETMKIQKEQDFAAAKQTWDRQREQLMQNVRLHSYCFSMLK